MVMMGADFKGSRLLVDTILGSKINFLCVSGKTQTIFHGLDFGSIDSFLAGLSLVVGCQPNSLILLIIITSVKGVVKNSDGVLIVQYLCMGVKNTFLVARGTLHQGCPMTQGFKKNPGVMGHGPWCHMPRVTKRSVFLNARLCGLLFHG